MKTLSNTNRRWCTSIKLRFLLAIALRALASALMEKVDVFAQEQGIRKVALDSWAFNHEAHRFFERLGFEPFNIKIEKIL